LSNIPFDSSSTFFRSSDEESHSLHMPRVYATSFAPHEDKKVCRWCLEVFDPEKQQHRSTRERGALRSNLMMADNGSELVCCDNCWQGAFGAKTLMHGVMTPCEDPTEIPNILLRGAI
jgi:hypothetical protein